MNIPIEDVCLKKGAREVSIFVGKFDPPTKAHIKLVKDAYSLYEIPVVICIVDSLISVFDWHQKLEVFYDCLDIPFIVCKQKNAFLGNIVDYLRKSELEPRYFICGEDRQATYQSQLDRYSEKFGLDLHIVSIARTSAGVSATKVRESLEEHDFVKFKENMDEKAWYLFNKLTS